MKNKIIYILAAMLLSVAASAQTLTVKGTVKEENGQAAIGASVMVSGTNIGVPTDIDGKYSISVKKGQVLIFTYLGYKDQQVMITGQTVVDVVLEPDTNKLDEIVVVGYGATKRSDLTGAVASVSAEKVEGFKSATVLEALGGQIAGVQITAADGTPGAGFDIKVRGVGSINGDASPLYVVDGFQVDNIDYLSNSDIESIEVLKDASSSAIYGSRAANGVVMVTTKSGKVGRPVVSYNGSANYRVISKYLDLMSTYDFVKMQMEAWPDKFANTYYKEGERIESIDYYLTDKGVDWQRETFRPTWSQDHNLSVSGGSDNTKYTLSINRFGENGIFTNSSFDKTTAKFRVNQKITKKITIDATLNYANTDKRGVGTSGDNGRFNMLAQILRARPTAGLRMTNEELLDAAIDPLELESSESLSQVNPIKQAQSVVNTKKAEMWSGNVSATIDLGKGWTWRSAATYNTTNTRNYIFYLEGSREEYRNGGVSGSNQMTRQMRWSNFNYLTYKPKLKGSHKVDVMVGQEMSGNSTEFLYGGATDFPFDNLGNYNLGLGATPTKVNSSYSEKKLLSFFTRGNYSFRDKYLLTATLRADGSTVFSDKHKWGVFPSFSAAWKVTSEPWMKSVPAVSTLKVRAGWGEVGNDRITNYLSLDLYSQGKYGLGNGIVTVLEPKQLANEDLRWESSQSTNIGVDAGFFKDRLTFTVDAFQKDTKDLLMAASIPYVTGFASQWQNVGKIRNSGLELTLHSVNFDTQGGFFWSTDFNVSFIKNRVLALAGDSSIMYTSASWNSEYTGYDYICQINSAIGNIYGYEYDGVYQDSDFTIDAATGKYILREGVADISDHGKTAAPGVVKYKDQDGDNIITTDDRTVIGNGNPDWFGGFTNNFAYKGIDLSVMFSFSVGNDIYNATRMFACQSQDQRSNMFAEVADRWTPSNASASVPAWDGYVKNELYSRFVEDGSYLRLKNVTLGYTLPKKITQKVHISKLRMYASAQNLWILTAYKGYDPEVSVNASNPMTPGLDWGAYPKSKVFCMGLDINF